MDGRRPQRRRLPVRGEPVCPGPRRLAGADLPDRRHRHRHVPDQLGGAAGRRSRRALPGGLPPLLRRLRRQHRRHHPRPDRDRLVRHPDLRRLEGADHRRAQVLPGIRGLRAHALPGPVLSRLVRLPDHVDRPVPGVLPGHEGDHRVHRLGRPGRLLRHVPADVLDDLPGRLEQHQLHARRGEVHRSSARFWQMVVAISLVISYFSGPMVNFSDFSRFAKDMPRSRRATSGACRSTSSRSRSSP